MVDDNIVELSEKATVKTPFGIYDGFLLDMHDSQSVEVIGIEAEGGILIIKNGSPQDIVIRGYLDLLVLDSINVSFMNVDSIQLILLDSTVYSGQLNVKKGMEISGSMVKNINIKSDFLESFRVKDAVLDNIHIMIAHLRQLILYGTRMKPINIIAGNWIIKSIDTLWLSGNQHWHSGFRLEIEEYRHVVGEAFKYIKVEDVYIPRWLEILLAYKDINREFSIIL